MSFGSISPMVFVTMTLLAGCTHANHTRQNGPQIAASISGVNELSSSRARVSTATNQSRTIPVIYADGSELDDNDEVRLKKVVVEYRPKEIHELPWFIYYHDHGITGRADVFFKPTQSSGRFRKGVMYTLTQGGRVAPRGYHSKIYLQVSHQSESFSDDLTPPSSSVIGSLPVIVGSTIADADVVSIVDQIREHAHELRYGVGDRLLEVPWHDSKSAGIVIRFHSESTIGDTMYFEGGPGHYSYRFKGVWVF